MRPLDYVIILNDHAVLRECVMRAPDDIYLGLTAAEIADYQAELVDELILDASFKLLTKFESDIKLDIVNTIKSGWQDPLSKWYRSHVLFSAAKDMSNIGMRRILQDLEHWFRQNKRVDHVLCAELRSYYDFRNWYAHGRFLQRMPICPVPARVEQLAQQLVLSIIDRQH